jgi:hypothetical protein
VDRHARERVARELALSGVDAGAELQSERVDGLSQGQSASNRPTWSIEGGKHAAAGPAQALPAVAGERAVDQLVVLR